MKFKDFLIEMFSSNAGISSKRVCGFIGWVVIIGLAIYGTISGKELPECTDTILFCISGLLGLDSITSIWKK